MTLMVILMTGLLIGLRVGVRAWQQGEARLRQAHREDERAAFLAEQIASLLPYEVLSAERDLPGRVSILEAEATRLQFVSSYGSRYRNRSGLLLADYAIVRDGPGRFALALRETPLGDDGALLGRLVERVATDPETGKRVVIYRPFALQGQYLKLMTGLQGARFEYLDPRLREANRKWVSHWEGRPEVPYPTAVRFWWRQEGQSRQLEETFPIPAHLLPKSRG